MTPFKALSAFEISAVVARVAVAEEATVGRLIVPPLLACNREAIIGVVIVL